MRLKTILRTVLALLALFLGFSRTALAVDLIVEQHPTDPSHFSSIQAAIQQAQQLLSVPTNTETFRVIIERGTFSGAGTINLISNVPIIGRETAETIITGSGTLFSANNVTGISIKNLTLQNAAIGIDISNNSSNITVDNNIMRINTVGVRVQGSTSVTIANNVFYQNPTAITRDSDIVITNNIFDGSQAVAISNPGQVATANVTYNDYFNVANAGVTRDIHSIPDTNGVGNPDPSFVDPANNDFHLQSDSPCKGTGNPNYENAFDTTSSDMGAYGGPDTDTIPFMISGLTSSLTDTSTISLSWNPNNSYQIQGYHVYYGTTPELNGTDAAEGPSPIKIAAGTTTATLSNIQTAVTVTPSTPVLNQPSPRDSSLVISWSPSANANSYNVYFSTAPFDASSLPSTVVTVEGGSNTSTILSGLTNGQSYYVAVSAVASNSFLVSVTAFNALNGTPGVSNESELSTIVPVSFGAPLESPISAVLTDFPEPIVPFPDLPNSGCFIATAAYGYYSAPQVQALRLFRDSYLMTNTAGRAFVRWYYRYGPSGAAFLVAHPWLKPLVRIALLPAVGGALLLTGTTFFTKIILLICLMLAAGTFVGRRLLTRPGGSR